MRATVIFLAVWAGACSTEVNAIEDTKPCADGPLHADGTPVLLGEDCYDQWALQIANPRNDIMAAVDAALPHCIALAEARGLSDTWSALEDPIDRAAAACASVDGADSGCMASFDGDPCDGISLTCPTDMPPAWLDEFKAALPAMVAACCTIEHRIAELSKLGLSLSCESSVPGVAQCLPELVSSLFETAEKAARMCSGVQVMPVNN